MREDEIVGIIHRQDWAQLRKGFSRGAAPDIGELLPELDRKRRILACKTLTQEVFPDQPVKSIMNRSFVAVSALEDPEKTAHLLQHYRLDALPVVD